MRTDEISPAFVRVHKVRVLIPRVSAASIVESSFRSEGAVVAVAVDIVCVSEGTSGCRCDVLRHGD